MSLFRSLYITPFSTLFSPKLTIFSRFLANQTLVLLCLKFHSFQLSQLEFLPKLLNFIIFLSVLLEFAKILLSKIFKSQMKQLIRRLSRVADSSQYNLLRSDSTQTRRHRRSESFRSAKSARRSATSKPVPEGYVPVYVGDEMERFVVSAELLNHPVFVGLLNKSAQEYGYEQRGVLHIPCHVLVFERVVESLRLGLESRDLEDLLSSVSDEYL